MAIEQAKFSVSGPIPHTQAVSEGPGSPLIIAVTVQHVINCNLDGFSSDKTGETDINPNNRANKIRIFFVIIKI